MNSLAKRRASRLGRTQKLVLSLLATNARSARELEYDWPSITESSARSAIQRLADRGLVDAAGWDQYGERRTYCLTDRGREVEASLIGTEEATA